YVIPALVPSFFALSGYLVAGSFERCRTIGMFIGLRVLRIFPALSVETILSAFILGPIFTIYSLGDYFSNPLLFSYLGNIVGHVQFELPGVFETNPDPHVVNGQLWTVPYELYCYIVTAFIGIFGMRGTVRRNTTIVWLLLIAAFISMQTQIAEGRRPNA